MKLHSEDLLKWFGVVATSVLASSLLAFLLKPYLQGEAPFLPFTLAVIASSWYGGLVPGLAATALSFVVADYFFFEPVNHLKPLSPIHIAPLTLFLVVGVSISLLQNSLSKANVSLRKALDQLDEAVHRSELAGSVARIGFHEFVAADERQIWTPEMERLFGLTPGTFEGAYDDWVKRMHPTDRDRVNQERADCIRQLNSDWKYEYRATLPDGEIRWIEGRSRMFFSKAGSLERIVGASIDVTERRNLEQALAEHAEQLARSNADLEQFAYIVSHDLQAPLRGIGATTELHLRRARGTLDEESIHLLDFVITSADRMKRLIQNILELARATHDQLDTSIEVDVGEVLKLAIRELQVSIRDPEARITVNSLPVIQADEGQLVRLFRNLLGNAIKYRGKNAPKIDVSAAPGLGGWVFCVSDNGIGIAPNYHGRIFEAFRRLHSTSRYDGTGLGLAICKRIVERHNGRIWVESEPGNGSRFYFTLPQKLGTGVSSEEVDDIERSSSCAGGPHHGKGDAVAG